MGLFSFSVTWDHNTCLSHLPGLFWGSRIWKHVVNCKVWYPCRMPLFCRWHFKKIYWFIWSMSPQPLCMGSLKPHRDSCLKPSRYRCANKGTFKIAQQSRGKAGPGSLDSSFSALYSNRLWNVTSRACEWRFFLLLAESERQEVSCPPGALPLQHLAFPSTTSAFTGFNRISFFS